MTSSKSPTFWFRYYKENTPEELDFRKVRPTHAQLGGRLSDLHNGPEDKTDFWHIISYSLYGKVYICAWLRNTKKHFLTFFTIAKFQYLLLLTNFRKYSLRKYWKQYKNFIVWPLKLASENTLLNICLTENMKIPISNCICLLITTFEQIFLNGLWSSWGMMANILKREGYFDDACKPSEIEENFK